MGGGITDGRGGGVAFVEVAALAIILVSMAYSDLLAMIHTTHDFTLLILAFIALYALGGM